MTTSTTSSEFDQKAFRRALGNFATGVTIITARAADGTNVGVTASSFSSLSLNPPLVLWSSIKSTPSCKVFEEASHFAVNILASNQMEMSNHFARQQEDKFANVEWEQGIGGAPVFPNCSARFECESYDKFDGGDHWIFVGKVVSYNDSGNSPLCFHQGSYSMVFSHPETFPSDGQDDAANIAESGRMSNHAFFLMLRAVRAYQERYRPKITTLGLNLVESRILLILHDFPGLGAEQIVVHLHTPVDEAHEALLSLRDRGLVKSKGDGYELTELGSATDEQCWAIAAAHAKESFDGFSEEEVSTFTKVLKHLISR